MNKLFKLFIPFAALLAVGCGGGGKRGTSPAPAPAPTAGTFTATGNLATPRAQHSATLLTSGKVLVAGGQTSASGFVPTASMETYDPAAGAFAPAAAMGTPRYAHTATLLRDGKVLLAGGMGGSALASAERYDPASNTVSPTGPMTTPRSNHTATLLTVGPDAGKVLIIGGMDTASAPLASMEVFDPAAGTFAPSPAALAGGRTRHTATVLEDGRVVIAGGKATSEVEVYDPATRTVAVAGSMLQARSAHTATLLPGSRLLFAGGLAGGALAGNEVCDLSKATPTFTAVQAMGVPRRDHNAILLPNGAVLITGGTTADAGFNVTAQAELFDAARLAFVPSGKQAEGTTNGTATLLPGGKVLVAGGLDYLLEPISDAALYQ